MEKTKLRSCIRKKSFNFIDCIKNGRNKYPHISFGIITGDITDNPEADVLIMTTEILPNTLINKKITNNSDVKIPLSFEMDF